MEMEYDQSWGPPQGPPQQDSYDAYLTASYENYQTQQWGGYQEQSGYQEDSFTKGGFNKGRRSYFCGRLLGMRAAVDW